MIVRIIALLLVALQLAGCATYAKYSARGLRQGDRVDLHMVDGRVHPLVVREAKEQEVCGDSGCVPAGDIRSVARRDELAVLQAIALIGLVVLGVALYSAGAAAVAGAAFR